MPFHLTARVQGREALFCGIEPTIVRMITATAPTSDATVLAYAVMPNHLHIVLVQGTKLLRDFMQPLLRRIALLVQRHHKREGHVFERRYNATVCRDPEYLRNAIIYVHLNPVRAGLCADASGYAWTSHHDYDQAPTTCETPMHPVLEGAVRLFSRMCGCTVSESCRDYRDYLNWRVLMDQHVDEIGTVPRWAPARPYTEGGDQHWLDVYGASSAGVAIAGYAHDLRDVAVSALVTLAPSMPLDELRSGGRSRPLVNVRRQVIARALSAGFRPHQIARFLDIAPTTVSLASRPR